MIDTLLLGMAFIHRDEALRYQTVIPGLFTQPMSNDIYRDTLTWWNDNPEATAVDVPALLAKLLVKHPKNEHDEIEMLVNGANVPASEETMGTIMARCHEQSFVSSVISDMILLEESAHPDGALVDVWPPINERFLETMEEVAAETTQVAAETLDIHSLLERKSRDGLGWCLPTLQTACGPIADDFIVVASRPDSGKTGLLLQQAVWMANQIKDDECVIIFRNEEGADKLAQRIFMLALGKPWADIVMMAPDDIQRELDAALGGGNRIIFYPRTSFNTHDVNEFLENHKPGAIIFDQLVKIDLVGKHDSNDAERIRRLCNWARQLTQTYTCPVFTTVWADGTAQNVEWIGMDQVYGSKTGIQGEADAVITIGRANPSDNVRSIFIPKNKLPDADNSARNARFHTTIDPVTVSFKE